MGSCERTRRILQKSAATRKKSPRRVAEQRHRLQPVALVTFIPVLAARCSVREGTERYPTVTPRRLHHVVSRRVPRVGTPAP